MLQRVASGPIDHTGHCTEIPSQTKRVNPTSRVTRFIGVHLKASSSRKYVMARPSGFMGMSSFGTLDLKTNTKLAVSKCRCGRRATSRLYRSPGVPLTRVLHPFEGEFFTQISISGCEGSVRKLSSCTPIGTGDAVQVMSLFPDLSIIGAYGCCSRAPCVELDSFSTRISNR